MKISKNEWIYKLNTLSPLGMNIDINLVLSQIIKCDGVPIPFYSIIVNLL